MNVVIGIDVSRDWLDGFIVPVSQRFRIPNTAAGHEALIVRLKALGPTLRVGFEATGGLEWRLWQHLVDANIATVQLPPAQIKSFARSRGTRAKTDRIDAELIAAFMVFRPEAGRTLPDETIVTLRTYTTKRAQLVEMRKRLRAQSSARLKQDSPAEIMALDQDLLERMDTQIKGIEDQIRIMIFNADNLRDDDRLLQSVPGIGPVCSSLLIAEMPELGSMTAAQAAAMAGLAPISRDSGALKGRRMIAGGRRDLRQALFQAALAATLHNPMLKTAALRLREKGKPHKVIIIAIARRLVTIANAILKSRQKWAA